MTDNAVRYLARRWGCTMDDILDMSVDDILRRYREDCATFALLQIEHDFRVRTSDWGRQP